jgi:hypothetical protein
MGGNMQYLTLLLGTLLVLNLDAGAQQVFKCKTPDNKITYSSTPCTGNSSGGEVNLQDNTIDTQALRQGQSRSQGSGPNYGAPPSYSGGVASTAPSPECANVRQQYEFELRRSGVTDTAGQSRRVNDLGRAVTRLCGSAVSYGPTGGYSPRVASTGPSPECANVRQQYEFELRRSGVTDTAGQSRRVNDLGRAVTRLCGP